MESRMKRIRRGGGDEEGERRRNTNAACKRGEGRYVIM